MCGKGAWICRLRVIDILNDGSIIIDSLNDKAVSIIIDSLNDRAVSTIIDSLNDKAVSTCCRIGRHGVVLYTDSQLSGPIPDLCVFCS